MKKIGFWASFAVITSSVFGMDGKLLCGNNNTSCVNTLTKVSPITMSHKLKAICAPVSEKEKEAVKDIGKGGNSPKQMVERITASGFSVQEMFNYLNHKNNVQNKNEPSNVNDMLRSAEKEFLAQKLMSSLVYKTNLIRETGLFDNQGKLGHLLSYKNKIPMNKEEIKSLHPLYFKNLNNFVRAVADAIRGGNLETVKYLVEKCGLNPNTRNLDRKTPLAIAENFRRADIANYLREHGASDN